MHLFTEKPRYPAIAMCLTILLLVAITRTIDAGVTQRRDNADTKYAPIPNPSKYLKENFTQRIGTDDLIRYLECKNNLDQIEMGPGQIKMDKCRSITRKKRIVSSPEALEGVNDAKHRQIPYQVAYIGRIRNKFHLCGAAILDKRHFLTAAHCTNNLRMDKFMVAAGSSYIESFYKYVGPLFEVEQIYTKGFVYNTSENDIALGRIKGRFVWNDFTKPITVRTNAVPEGTECTVSGWGRSDPSFGKISQKLQVVTVGIRHPTICLHKFPDEMDISDKICAGNGTSRVCHGDTGSPLVCGGQLTGVVSQNPSCKLFNLPVLFTNVTYHIDWIKSTLKKSYADGEKKKV